MVCRNYQKKKKGVHIGYVASFSYFKKNHWHSLLHIRFKLNIYQKSSWNLKDYVGGSFFFFFFFLPRLLMHNCTLLYLGADGRTWRDCFLGVDRDWLPYWGDFAVGFTSHQVMSPDCYRGLQGVCCVGLVLQKKSDISYSLTSKLGPWGRVSPYIFMSSFIKYSTYKPLWASGLYISSFLLVHNILVGSIYIHTPWYAYLVQVQRYYFKHIYTGASVVVSDVMPWYP